MAVTTPELSPQSAPAMPAAQPPKKRPIALIVAAAIGGLVLLLAAVGTVVYVATGTEAITATGTLTISEVADKTCTGSYSGVGQGAQVTVTDPSGTIVGVGRLGAAKASDNPQTVPFGDTQVRVGGMLCEFPFQVAGIPAGKASYGVKIGTHPPTQFTERELRQGLRLQPAS